MNEFEAIADSIDKITKKIGIIVIYTIMIILTIGGFFGMVIGTKQVYLAHQSSNWDTVSGIITYSNIRTIRKDERNNSYQPIIKYKYTVQDRILTNDRILFGQLFFQDFNEAFKIIKSYSVGQKIIVYYDSKNPNNSVLEVGLKKKSFIRLTAGSFFFTLFGTVTFLIWCFN